MSERPRRSALYVPGSNARALEKARGLPADVLLLDLEDAVAPDRKGAARDTLAESLSGRGGGFGHREVVVRVNGPDTPWWADDLALVAATRPDAVLLPKVEHPAVVAQARSVTGLPVWCMLETPRGVLRAEAIAAAEGVECLVMGTSDLLAALGAEPHPERLPLLPSLGLCLLAARAWERTILDGVHLELDDAAGFERACRQGVALGFDGKTLIHPRTIDAANQVFSPTPQAIAGARRLVAAHAEARARGQEVLVLDGRLVEHLHVQAAHRLLARAEAIAARGAQSS